MKPGARAEAFFDKDTRRKPLAFVADAGYGDWMGSGLPIASALSSCGTVKTTWK
jgi:hypothetical protein